MREGVSTGRLQSRRQLLDELNRGHSRLTGVETDSLRDQQNLAFGLLTSGKLTEAFEINRETDATRDRYGRNKFGQSLLLSKRMIEAGVPVVQATMGIVQTWDTHTDNWGKLKNTIVATIGSRLGGAHR